MLAGDEMIINSEALATQRAAKQIPIHLQENKETYK